MHKTAFNSILALLILFTVQLSSQNSYTTKIDSLIEICHKRGIFNGNALVVKGDTIIYRTEKGFTDGSKAHHLNKASIFDIGSISKEFSAVGIMMLKEKGLLDLGDKLSKFDLGLPDWSEDVSVKHLLKYSSGLPSVDWQNVHSDKDVFEDLRNLKSLEFEPGNGYLYSNNNNFLQKRIIEKLTGKTFNMFVKENIFRPLEMNSSVVDHQYDNPNFVRAFNSNYVNDEKLELKMSGSVCPSIDDLSKWSNALMSYKLISKESLNQLFDTYSQESQSALGNSSFENGKLMIYTHHGSSINYESIVHYNLQEKTMIILMTNSKSLKIDEIRGAISNILKNEDYKIPQKSVYMTIREITYDDVDKGITLYKQLKQDSFDTYNFSDQWELARLSYKLFEQNQEKSAVKILKLLISELPIKSEEVLEFLRARILSENQVDKSILVYKIMVAKFPSGKSHSGLGDALFKKGQTEAALISYKKSLELEPENVNSKKMIVEIGN